MVNAKNRKGASVQLDYVIHIQEIKPWPPSQSLRSLRSVLIQWENGDRKSGSTHSVVPTFGSIVGEGKIEFNESFRLPVTLFRDVSSKGKDTDSFQKNFLEFNLCEPRRDKIQTLATGVIDLADFGIVKETISASTPMNSNRSFRNTSQPILYLKVQPVVKGHMSSSLRDGVSKGNSQERKGGESVSALMNEEYTEEAEVASFTDDHISSHSSLTNGGLPPQDDENRTDELQQKKTRLNSKNGGTSKPGVDKHTASQENLKEGQSYSPMDLSSDFESPVYAHASGFKSSYSGSKSISKNEAAHRVNSSSSISSSTSKEEEASIEIRISGHLDFMQEFDENDTDNSIKLRADTYNVRAGGNSMDKSATENNAYNIDMKKHQEEEQNSHSFEQKRPFLEDERVGTFPQNGTIDEGSLGIAIFSSSDGTEMKGNSLKIDRLKHIKSVRSSSDPAKNNGLVGRYQQDEAKEFDALVEAQNTIRNFKVNERNIAKVYQQDTRTTIISGKVQQLENRIKMLEGELREAAGVEAALYSVVAEHGSSINKVHAPARRLSRLYIHACRENSRLRRSGAARSAVSGLLLVAKACGNDVPRLTFWLSNSVVLRAIISQAIGDKEISLPYGQNMERSPFKWIESSSSRNGNKNICYGGLSDMEDPHTFLYALEKIEAWIFSRTVESIWWQTLIPHMQFDATKAIDSLVSSGSKQSFGRMSSAVDQDQVNFSLELWKNAFKDACERLCPVRAGGHNCGCLPELARLIMEQCVERLDVAMFNAILRESADDIPTDPVSDPISDSRVLPIPARKSSFGAGAQLKNAIGNWSRWLTDLFGIDDELLEDENDKDGNDERKDAFFKSFYLLNALSDLMMLPKDMLLSKSIRKEVCPTFGAPLIKRVLENFISDEFCPDPIPDVVLEALGSVDAVEAKNDCVTTTPRTAAPPFYSPPSAASVAATIGQCGTQSQLRRSGSFLRKSYTSDDELDELSSPLASIFIYSSRPSPPPTKLTWKPKEVSNQRSARYELLRDVWMNA